MAGARVTVVSPEVCDELSAMIDEGKVSYIPRRFEAGDVNSVYLVYAATSSRSVNRHVLEWLPRKPRALLLRRRELGRQRLYHAGHHAAQGPYTFRLLGGQRLPASPRWSKTVWRGT